MWGKVKIIIALVASSLAILGLSGCGPQDGPNRDIASEQDVVQDALNRDFPSEQALVAALANEGFECPIFDEFVAAEFGEAGIEQAEKDADLYGWKSRSWCYPEPNTGEIGINIFANSSGAEKAGLDFTCNGTATTGRFIQVKNWILTSDDLGVMNKLANLAQTQVRTWPNC